MMARVDPRTLIDRGRKAGLGTSELYAALSARPPEVSDALAVQSDGNGYVSRYGLNGQRVYRPLDASTTP
jgi:hypothetical protein